MLDARDGEGGPPEVDLHPSARATRRKARGSDPWLRASAAGRVMDAGGRERCCWSSSASSSVRCAAWLAAACASGVSADRSSSVRPSWW